MQVHDSLHVRPAPRWPQQQVVHRGAQLSPQFLEVAAPKLEPLDVRDREECTDPAAAAAAAGVGCVLNAVLISVDVTVCVLMVLVVERRAVEDLKM